MRRDQPLKSIIDNFKDGRRMYPPEAKELADRISNYSDETIWNAYVSWYQCDEPGGEIGILDFIDNEGNAII